MPHPEWPTRVLLLDWQEFFGLREAERERQREKAARRGRRKAAGVAEGGVQPPAADAEPTPELDDAPDVVFRLGRRRVVGFRTPPDVADAFKQALRRTHQATGWRHDDGACVHLMLIEFAHAHVDPAHWKRHAIHERDSWQCAMPRCRARRRFEIHHRRYRSAGGGDEPANLVTTCRGCHALVHSGRVVLLGEAPDALVLLVGRDGHGRPREVWRGALRAA